jgi:cobalt-zinc-cadmium efflux system membrane fusion protein
LKNERFGAIRLTSLLVLCSVFGCAKPGSRGHDHGQDHDHDHGVTAGTNEEPPTLVITRWSERYELFVELSAPAPRKPVRYHAHVTRLDGFQAVTEGTFRVRFKSGSTAATEASTRGVKRPGIFVFEGAAPAPGEYTLEMVYEHDGQSDVFDCGTVAVAEPPITPPEEPGSTIAFLKESQWKIPFGTAWAEERPLASEIELPATVEPAGTDQLTIGAPTAGRFFHNPKLSLAEGLRVNKGDVIGRIAPTVAGDDYTRLVSAVEEARLLTAQTEREIARIAPLVEQQLLPERRLIELRNELETLKAQKAQAGSRLGRVTAPGGEAGLPVKSTLEGLVSHVLVPNGEPVESGAPLVRIGGTERVWIRARFVSRPTTSFRDAAPAAVRLPSGNRIDFDRAPARFLSPLPIVDTSSRIATWIVDVAPASEAEPPSELRPGTSVVLSVRMGEPKRAVAVKRGAVVEINTRTYVFVQIDGEHFEKRAVTLGRKDGPFVEIVSGVRRGERVVERGGFDVHLASLMGTIESHRH